MQKNRINKDLSSKMKNSNTTKKIMEIKTMLQIDKLKII